MKRFPCRIILFFFFLQRSFFLVCVCVLGRSLATVHRGETVKRICCSFLLMAQSAGRSKRIIKDDSILGRCFVLSFFLFTSCETRNATRPDGSAPMNWMEAIDRDVAASFFFAFVVVFCSIENHYDRFLFLFCFASPVMARAGERSVAGHCLVSAPGHRSAFSFSVYSYRRRKARQQQQQQQ